MTSNASVTVANIFRYPVKSMGGEKLESSMVFGNGLFGDRRYSVVDVGSEQVASAKVPRRWGDLLNFSARYVDEPAPDQGLPPVEITFPDGSVRRSDSERIHAELSRALGKEVRLVSEAPESAWSESIWQYVEGHEATSWTRDRTVGTEDGKDVVRWVLAEAVPHVPGQDTFQDVGALHLLTTSTLRHLTDLSPDVDFDPMRFRPNILLETPEGGFPEQRWVGKTLWAKDLGMSVTAPTPRCAMPTLRQARHELAGDRRVLQSIARHNTIEADELGEGRWACAGVYGAVVGQGRVHVGDSLTLNDLVPPSVSAGNGPGS